jgi:hypothetical protein
LVPGSAIRRGAIEALFREELAKARFDPGPIEVGSTGLARRLFAVKVVLPEEHWGLPRPALLTARRRAEKMTDVPVGASFYLGGRTRRKRR